MAWRDEDQTKIKKFVGLLLLDVGVWLRVIRGGWREERDKGNSLHVKGKVARRRQRTTR